MSGRIHEVTPEGRLATVARELALAMKLHHRETHTGPEEPDYADYREALRPYVQKELLLARIDEARKSSAAALTMRMFELDHQLAECDKLIPQGPNK
jgi:hypothetical protein